MIQSNQFNTQNTKITSLKVSSFLSKTGMILFVLSCIFSFISPTADLIAFIFALGCYVFSGKYFNPRLKSLNLLWIAYFLLLTFSQVINSTFLLKDLLANFVKLSSWFICSGLIQQTNTKFKREIFISVFIFSSVFSLMVLLQALNLFPTKCQLFPSSQCGIERVGFLNPFVTGMLLLLGFFSNLRLSEKIARIKQRIFLKYIVVFLLVIQFLAIVFAGQRSIILGLLFGILIWAIFLIKKWGVLPLIFVGILVLVSGITAIKLSPVLQVKLQNLLQKNDVYGVNCRLEAWGANWHKFLHNPLIGQGRAIAYSCKEDLLKHAHNIYIQKLVETGIIGFGFIFSFFGKIFISFSRSRNYKVVLACFGALAVIGIFDEWMTYHAAIVKFFILILILTLNDYESCQNS